MRNIINSALVLISCLLILGIAGSSGCATSGGPPPTPQQTQDRLEELQTIADSVVYSGVLEALGQKPALREDIEAASAGLDQLVALHNWDARAVASALQRSGIEEFRDPRNVLIAAEAPVLFDSATGHRYALNQNQYVEAFTRGAASGARRALDADFH